MAGIAYVARVRSLLSDLEQAEQEVTALAGGEPSGHLRVSLPGSFGAAWLGPAIAGFLAAFPRVTMEADTSNRFVKIVEERYDAAIRLGILPDSGLIARKIAERRRLLCASPDYIAAHGTPQSPEDLRGHACLFSTEHANPGKWSFEDDGAFISVDVPGRFTSSNAEFLVDAARAGIGILYTSDWYAAADLTSGRLVEVLSNYPVAERGGVYIVTPASRGMPSKTRAFIDWIAAHLQNAPWRNDRTG